MGIKSNSFISENFLLNSKEAEILYHQYAKEMPIIDYHNHLSPKQIAEDLPINNITELWLSGDHYKWRGMRANGVEEKYISGNASNEEKFGKWAETVPFTIRNPLFHWTQLELKRYFNIDAILQPSTADEIYRQTNEILSKTTPTQLLKQMKVEVVCTTDDPTDDLHYHKQIANRDSYTKVFPTFRSDNLFLIQTDGYLDYIAKLEKCVGFSINTLADFITAIDSRIDYFHESGCKLSDFGISGASNMVDVDSDEVGLIFDKRLKGIELLPEEVDQFKSLIFIHLGKKYHEKNWVQQYHLGPIRNNNSKLKELIGADAGCDSIGDYSYANFMSVLFNKLEESGQLAKTITYNLNPSQNEVFASMMGNFNDSSIPGKMQWGAPWWYLDQKDGIENHLNILSNIGLLSRFVGMLTDSRSLLSFTRHEYFRRILCDVLAEDIKKGLIPDDIEFVGSMIQDICYNNATSYFNFK